MSKFLLDFVMPITVITPTPPASTAFLKQVCLIAKPKAGQEGNVGEIYECTLMSQVAARTDNVNALQFFDAGMSKVYILLSNELDLSTYFDEAPTEFFTLIASDDYSDADIAATAATGTVTISSYANLIDAGFDSVSVAGVAFVAQAGAATLGTATFRAATSNDLTAESLAAQINGHETVGAKVLATVVGAIVTITSKLTGIVGNTYALAYADNGTATVGASVSGAFLSGGDGLSLGLFKGVFGISSTDAAVARAQSIIENRSGWPTTEEVGATNMCYAFGKLLSNLSNWTNLQYIPMPEEGVTTLGDANSYFDDRMSFVITDDEFGNRLGLFAAGSKAIVATYIYKNLMIDLQSKTLQWISANQPDYTVVEAAKLQNRLEQDVVLPYIERKWLQAATIDIAVEQENFIASGDIQVSQPKAFWRVYAEMRETL
jgi:hypothetical protein